MPAFRGDSLAIQLGRRESRRTFPVKVCQKSQPLRLSTVKTIMRINSRYVLICNGGSGFRHTHGGNMARKRISATDPIAGSHCTTGLKRQRVKGVANANRRISGFIVVDLTVLHGGRTVRSVTDNNDRAQQRGMSLVLLGLLTLGFASCRSSHDPSCRSEAPPPHRAETNIDPGWPRANNSFRQVSYTAVHGSIPTLAGAEMVKDDDICMQCHEAYVKAFHENVHRVLHCEDCHGPASRHLETQGKEPGLIFSFKKGVDPIARAEACLKCHEQNQCSPGSQWRTSKHAHVGVTCVDCHRGHYNVPVGTPATTVASAATFARPRATLVSYDAAEAEHRPRASRKHGSELAHAAAMPVPPTTCRSDRRPRASRRRLGFLLGQRRRLFPSTMTSRRTCLHSAARRIIWERWRRTSA